jgi:hypothetical protein
LLTILNVLFTQEVGVLFLNQKHMYSLLKQRFLGVGDAALRRLSLQGGATRGVRRAARERRIFMTARASMTRFLGCDGELDLPTEQELDSRGICDYIFFAGSICDYMGLIDNGII